MTAETVALEALKLGVKGSFASELSNTSLRKESKISHPKTKESFSFVAQDSTLRCRAAILNKDCYVTVY